MEDKNKMRETQANKCSICDLVFPDDKSAYVDHCHETNEVRGLLCQKCNSGLGMFGDKVSNVQRAVAYLLKHAKRSE